MEKSLEDYINDAFILLNVEASSKNEAISELLSFAESKGLVFNRESAEKRIFSNERVISTGLGYGVAFPHAHLPDIEDTKMIFGISKRGVIYDSLDGKPVHLIIVFLTRADKRREYLQHLSTIADMSHLTMNIVLLLESQTEEEFKRKIKNFIMNGGMRINA